MAIGLAALADILSDTAAAQVAASARRVAAIRLGARRHLCATLWSSDVAVTCSRCLPDQDGHLLLLNEGHAIARLTWRDAKTGLAGLHLAPPSPLPACPPPGPIAADAWLMAVGVDETGSPVASLAVPQGHPSAQAGSAPATSFGLDRAARAGDCGGPLIAPSGALAGIVICGNAIAGDAGLARVIPYPEVSRLVGGSGAEHGPHRGWLGVGLQPSLLPTAFCAMAGQSSGRKVVEIIQGGPADRAGLRPGDIVLTIADQSMVGEGAVREFLRHTRAGETAQVTLLRGGELMRLTMTIGENPAP